MVGGESVIIAMIGTTLGIVIGILFFFLLIVQGQRDGGLTFVLRAGRLAVYAGIAVVAGILAAVFPARTAARLNVLRAIAHE